MVQLTDRVRLLRDEAVNKKSYMHLYSVQRNVYYQLGVSQTRGKNLSNEEIVAEGLASVIEKFRPFIAPGELVVGVNYGEPALSEWDEPENDENGLRVLRENGFTEEEIEAYFDAKIHAHDDFQFAPAPVFTKEEIEVEKEHAGTGRCIDANHSVIGYEKVLRLGFDGLLQEVKAHESKNGDKPLYRALTRLCEASAKIGEIYALEAERLMDDPSYNKDDLKTIINTCRKVPRRPAETFFEAVQAIWFSHLINTYEDHINANSVGRLDQILYPYYIKDIERGVLTKDQAFEIVCLLWIKLYRDYDVQQSCVGGTDVHGNSQVNDLSWMMLDATEQLDFIRCLSVRFSKNTEKAFIQRALQVVGHVKKGVPFFFNDDVMIPALESKGISHEDACDYTEIGCVETVIPGKSNPHAVTGETNLLKAIEYVLGNGHSLMYPGYKPGIETGELESFKTYEDFYNAVKAQVERIHSLVCSKVVKLTAASCVNSPRPYKSLLTEGCLEFGLDFNQHGAKYDYYQIMQGGVPNLADSLMVIKKYVYDEKKYTLLEIRDMMVNDFPDEAIRREFINKAPKYGNDIDEVDAVAADIIRFSCEVLEKLSKRDGLSYHAQPFTYLWMVEHGQHSAASPDGRHKGEITAYSVSPMQGRDMSGLTAVLNTISKLPTTLTPGATSAIIEVDPKLFTDDNIPMLTDILVACGKRGLSNVQFNTVDANMLLDAQKYPEKYNNLAVRVSGFSQKFNLISKELQDHIIGRTKHACV